MNHGKPTTNWEMVIGLEIHAQIISNSKLFSAAATAFGAEPNHHVSLVDAAFPGMLPVINARCVEQAVRTGLGLNAVINKRSVFDRKNYFYADLPAGYQISQYKYPLVGAGRVTIDLPDGSSKEIGITRLHLEMDAGKSLHDQHPTKSYIDLNRAGVALMEIVSEPELRTADEAVAYIKKLRAIMRYLGSCDGNMEQGNLRVDVNLSMRRAGEPFGTRTETKNMNSLRFIHAAIEYEAQRQIAILESGGVVEQETRLWDTTKGITRTMRSKENAHDYRYFPDPDLLPLVLTDDFIAAQKKHLPELPDDKKQRFIKDYQLAVYDAVTLCAERDNADYFEAVVRVCRNPLGMAKLAANWVMVELFAVLNDRGLTIAESPVTADNLAGLLNLINDNTISGKIAKDVFAAMIENGQTAAAIVEAKGLQQITDTSAIAAAIDAVLAANPEKLAEYRAGKDKLFGFFVGLVMKATGGKANPAALNELLQQKLNP